MKSELLKPCAHCGHDAEHLIMDGWDRIGCKLCGTLGGRYRSKERAIKFWNTRTGETAPTMSEEELLNMMPPEKCEEYPKYPCAGSMALGHNQARQEIARALSGKIAKPRKVEREKILSIILLLHNKGVTDGDIADLIMKEIGDE